MANQSLIERTADKKSSVPDSETTQLAADLKVKSGVVYYQEVNSTEWSKLIGFQDLLNRDIGSIEEIYNVTLSEQEYNKIKELKSSLRQAWNPDIEMYRLEPIMDEDGDLKELVIPMSCELHDNITISSIHNSSGEFVADDIEEQVDFDMYKLRNMDLYVKEIPQEDESVQVYTKYDNRYIDLFEEQLNSITSNNTDYIHQETVEDYLRQVIGSVTLIPVAVAITIVADAVTSSIIFTLILSICCVIFGLAAIIFLSQISLLIHCVVRIMRDSKEKEVYRQK